MRKLQIALLLVLTLAGVSRAGRLMLGSRHKDESNGFRIQIPRKWEQVPTKFQDVATVGKWSGSSRDRRKEAPALFVLRFLQASDDEPRSPGEALGNRVPPGSRGAMRYQPKDIWEFAGRYLSSHDVIEDEPEFRMSSKKVKAHLRVLRSKVSKWTRENRKEREWPYDQRVAVVAEVRSVEEGDSVFGVVYLCNGADAEDMVRSFKNSIKGFRILDLDEEDEEEGEGGVTDADIFVDSATKPDAWREARKRKLIKGWKALDTENYLIVYNEEVKKPLLRNIAKHIEALRAQVYEKLFPPAKQIQAISVVRVCKDKQEYHRYGGPMGSAGYWSRGDEELVFYQDKSNKKDSLRVLYHEAFHQYIHYAVGDVAPHSWFNEGHGDYFAGHNYSSGKFKSAPFRWRTGIIANAISTGTYVPLRDFLKYTQGEYYANAGLCYAQGWSFVYFLREVEKRKIKKYKKYWGLLDKYFDGIKANVKSVKEGGFYGLENQPEPEGETNEGGDEGQKEEPPGLPRLPGLEQPFPGEPPEAGAVDDGRGTGETRSVAGPRITGVRSALDAAVDDAFKGIDLTELEKDWIEFSK